MGVKQKKIILTKTLSEKPIDHNNPFNSHQEQNRVMKLRRLDKVLLDENGNRRPTNLAEFLFGDQSSGYYLLRDNNLKCYVTFDEILKVFGKVLKPLYRSYANLKKQYDDL